MRPRQVYRARATCPGGRPAQDGATIGRIVDTTGDDIGDNSFTEPRVGDDDDGNPFTTALTELRATWEFNIDPVRTEIDDAVAVFFEVSITDKVDPLGQGDATKNLQLQAMNSAGEDGSRATP